jgi:hypothetical protein
MPMGSASEEITAIKFKVGVSCIKKYNRTSPTGSIKENVDFPAFPIPVPYFYCAAYSYTLWMGQQVPAAPWSTSCQTTGGHIPQDSHQNEIK